MTLARFGALATILIILSICCTSVGATTVRIRAIDPAGRNLSKVLVIIRSLDGGHTDSRALTGANGLVPEVDVPPGLYEAIATCPYSPWLTDVKDFTVEVEPVTLEMELDLEPDQRVSLNSVDWHVKVVDAQGRPVANAWVTGRNLDGTTGVSVVSRAV